VAAAAGAILLSGCGVLGGQACSDVGWQPNVVVRVAPDVAREAATLEVRLCQGGRCGDVVVDERGRRRPTYVAMDALGRFEPGDATVTVTAVAADGTVVARREQATVVEDWHPDGPGCPSYPRLRTALTADDRP
jgi:hypothetical protein